MATAAPVPGKCGAKARKGGYCGNDPVKGEKRCRMHGGIVKPAIQHGLASGTLKLRYADQHIRDRLEEIIADPGLLDTRRAVAVSQVALEGMPFEPRREDAERMAWAALRRKLLPGAEEPEELPEGVVDEIFHELRAVYAERVVANANSHARTTALAAKQEKVAEILVRGAMPIMRRFAERVAGLVKKYLPPGQQAEFLQGLKRIIEETQLEIVKFGEEADKLSKG